MMTMPLSKEALQFLLELRNYINSMASSEIKDDKDLKKNQSLWNGITEPIKNNILKQMQTTVDKLFQLLVTKYQPITLNPETIKLSNQRINNILSNWSTPAIKELILSFFNNTIKILANFEQECLQLQEELKLKIDECKINELKQAYNEIKKNHANFMQKCFLQYMTNTSITWPLSEQLVPSNNDCVKEFCIKFKSEVFPQVPLLNPLATLTNFSLGIIPLFNSQSSNNKIKSELEEINKLLWEQATRQRLIELKAYNEPIIKSKLHFSDKEQIVKSKPHFNKDFNVYLYPDEKNRSYHYTRDEVEQFLLHVAWVEKLLKTMGDAAGGTFKKVLGYLQQERHDFLFHPDIQASKQAMLEIIKDYLIDSPSLTALCNMGPLIGKLLWNFLLLLPGANLIPIILTHATKAIDNALAHTHTKSHTGYGRYFFTIHTEEYCLALQAKALIDTSFFNSKNKTSIKNEQCLLKLIELNADEKATESMQEEKVLSPSSPSLISQKPLSNF